MKIQYRLPRFENDTKNDDDDDDDEAHDDDIFLSTTLYPCTDEGITPVPRWHPPDSITIIPRAGKYAQYSF